jgi:hypothetical protein
MNLDRIADLSGDAAMPTFPPNRWCRGLTVLTWAAAGIGLSGCSETAKPTYPVHGQVMIEGKPAARALVAFHPVGATGREAVHPAGQADEKGNFTLTTFAAGDGAPPGEYQVTVVCLVPTKVRNRNDDETVTRNVLPARYAKAETSQLRATVAKGDNTLQAFTLKTK